jgi:hypothetical protein
MVFVERPPDFQDTCLDSDAAGKLKLRRSTEFLAHATGDLGLPGCYCTREFGFRIKFIAPGRKCHFLARAE